MSDASGLKIGQFDRERNYIFVINDVVSYEGKLQITSTKLQINLKSQYPITETHLHFPGRKGNLDLE